MTDKRDAWDQYPAERATIADAVAASPSGVTVVQHDYPGDLPTLAAFLSARLDDDEAVARAAAGWEGESWAVHPGSDGTREHIARHDPVRVLADVEAKRKIVALHGREVHQCLAPEDEEGAKQYFGEPDPPCHVLRLLALPYADHPDYDPSWVVS